MIERQNKIKAMLQRDHTVRVNRLAEELNVSVETIRRDLAQFEKEGLIKKYYGGAMLLESMDASEDKIIPVSQRESSFFEEKIAIGKKAMELIQEDQVVLLDAGTTTWCVAKHFNTMANITVITNGLNIAEVLGQYEAVSLYLVGGSLQRRTMSFVSPRPEIELKQFNADLAFIGTTGISINKCFTSHDMYEAEMKKAMIDSAKTTVIVADHSKFEQPGLISFCEFQDIDILITSDLTNQDTLNEIEKLGVEVLITRS